MDDLFVQLQTLENTVQAQEEFIEHLKSHGIFGWFQRRRIRKMMEGKILVRRLREDSMRAQILRLKEELSKR